MKFFSFERRWLRAVLDSILPSCAHPTLDLAARAVPLDRFVDDLLLRAPTLAVLGVRASLWVITLSPLARGRLRLFRSLAPYEQIALLEALARSRIHLLREVPVLLKTLACLGYCGVPEVQRRVGIELVASTPPRWMAP